MDSKSASPPHPVTPSLSVDRFGPGALNAFPVDNITPF